MIAGVKSGQRGVTLIELIVFIIVVSVGLAGVLSVLNLVTRTSADPLVTKQAMAVADAMMEEILLKDFCDPTPAIAFSGLTTLGSAVVTGIVPGTAGIGAGWRVSGNGVDGGATVASVDTATQLTLSSNAIQTFGVPASQLRAMPCTASVEASRDLWDDVGDYNGYATVGAFSLNDLVTPVLANYDVSVVVAAPAAAVAGVPVADIWQVTVTVTYNAGADTFVLTGYRFFHD